jgi:hypothetical protein
VGRVIGRKSQNSIFRIRVKQVQTRNGVVVFRVDGAVTQFAGAALGYIEVALKGLLSRAVFTAVEEFEAFLKVALVGGKNLGLLSCGR